MLALVIGNQEFLTTGVILNQYSPNVIEVELLDQKFSKRSTNSKSPYDTEVLISLWEKMVRHSCFGSMRAGYCVTVKPVVRASLTRFRNQEYHKSLVLIIGDEEFLTTGVILNQYSPNAIEVELLDQKFNKRSTVKILIRYGDSYAFKGEDGEG